MTLTIDDPEAERLAHVLAEITGESVADAVINAIRERLQRVSEKESLRQDLRRIQQHFVAAGAGLAGSPDEVVGYDEYGLP